MSMWWFPPSAGATFVGLWGGCPSLCGSYWHRGARARTSVTICLPAVRPPVFPPSASNPTLSEGGLHPCVDSGRRLLIPRPCLDTHDTAFYRLLHEKAYSVICARPPFPTHDDDDSASCALVISGGPVCSIFCARPPIGKCVVIDDDDDASCAAAMQLSLSPC